MLAAILLAACASVPDGTYRASSDTLEPIERSSGFYVALAGLERTAERATPETVKRYASEHSAFLQSAFLGVWSDSGKTYLDVSVWVPSIDDAIAIGLQNRQLAIWDCANAQALRLEHAREHATAYAS